MHVCLVPEAAYKPFKVRWGVIVPAVVVQMSTQWCWWVALTRGRRNVGFIGCIDRKGVACIEHQRGTHSLSSLAISHGFDLPAFRARGFSPRLVHKRAPGAQGCPPPLFEAISKFAFCIGISLGTRLIPPPTPTEIAPKCVCRPRGGGTKGKVHSIP